MWNLCPPRESASPLVSQSPLCTLCPRRFAPPFCARLYSPTCLNAVIELSCAFVKSDLFPGLHGGEVIRLISACATFLQEPHSSYTFTPLDCPYCYFTTWVYSGHVSSGRGIPPWLFCLIFLPFLSFSISFDLSQGSKERG